jgi:pSer/pThr/pTyr-binding forkhead associated (FHA) protein
VVNASLILVTADKPPREVPLKKSTLIVGRQDTCHIRIPSDSVSRQHCELRVEDDAVTVRDLGSSNGTFVNKRRVNQTELAAGDVLSIGSFTFVVKIGDAPPSVDPVKVLAAASPVLDPTKSAPDHPAKPSSASQPKPSPKPAPAKPAAGGKGSVLDEIDTETLSKMADDSSFAEFDFSDDDEKNQPKL